MSETRAPRPLHPRAQSGDAARIRNLLARVTDTRGRVRLADDIPERFRDVERITTTAFGRFRGPVTWRVD